MVHSITLVIVLVVLMPFAGMIPMPTIAAILFIVAYNMCQWRTFVHLIRTAPKSDIIVLFATFILTILFDLVVAIEIGMVLACLLFIKRMSEETHIDGWTYVDDDTPDVDAHLKKLHCRSVSYEIIRAIVLWCCRCDRAHLLSKTLRPAWFFVAKCSGNRQYRDERII